MGASGQLRKKIQKKNTPEPGGAVGAAAQMTNPSKAGGQVDANKKRQVEDVAAMLLTFVHDEKTAPAVMQMLESQPDGRKAVPMAMNAIMKQVEQSANRRRIRFPNDVKVAAAIPVIQDLALLGNEAQVWEQPIMQEELPDVIRDTLQMYIEQGLKDKSIDPIKLQKEVEQLMNDDAKQQMRGIASETGLPQEPTATMAARQHTEKKVGKVQGKNDELQAQLQALRSQGQASAQQPQQPAPQQNPAQQGNPEAALQQPI